MWSEWKINEVCEYEGICEHEANVIQGLAFIIFETNNIFERVWQTLAKQWQEQVRVHLFFVFFF
jgi:hypothetical protein